VPSPLIIQECISWLSENLGTYLGDSTVTLKFQIVHEDFWQLNTPVIARRVGSSYWRFSSDAIAWEDNSESQLVLLNYSSSAISLKDVGELYCVASVVKPTISFLLSEKGISNEVRLQLVEDEIRNRLLWTRDGSPIVLSEWSGNQNKIIIDSLLPIESRNILFANL